MRHLAFRLPSSGALEEMIDTAVAIDQTAEALADAILADEPHRVSYILHIYYEPSGSDAALLEARYSGVPLGGPYSARKDQAHSAVNDLHCQRSLETAEIWTAADRLRRRSGMPVRTQKGSNHTPGMPQTTQWNDLEARGRPAVGLFLAVADKTGWADLRPSRTED